MAEVLRNTNSPIYHQIFWKGEVRDADYLPVVKLYDVTDDPFSTSESPDYYLLDVDAEKDETNIGLYFITLPLMYTANNATLRAIWEYEMDGETVQYKHDIFIVTPYTDLYQAYGSLGVSADPSDPNYKSYKELTTAERYSRKKIEEYTGQKFYLYNDEVRVFGQDSDTLVLTQKIVNIRKIYMDDILMLDNTVTPKINNWGYNIQVSESEFGIRINRAYMLDNTVYVANGMVPPSIHDTSGVFKDSVAYGIQGQFGWQKVPDEVELASVELMKDFFSKDNLWKNQYIQNIQTFDWQFEYSSEVFGGTGNAYADKLLIDYVIDKAAII
jgi:hypothetical protein